MAGRCTPIRAHRQQVPTASSLAAEHRWPHCKQDECTSSPFLVGYFTPPLFWDGGMVVPPIAMWPLQQFDFIQRSLLRT